MNTPSEQCDVQLPLPISSLENPKEQHVIQQSESLLRAPQALEPQAGLLSEVRNHSSHEESCDPEASVGGNNATREGVAMTLTACMGGNRKSGDKQEHPDREKGHIDNISHDVVGHRGPNGVLKNDQRYPEQVVGKAMLCGALKPSPSMLDRHTSFGEKISTTSGHSTVNDNTTSSKGAFTNTNKEVIAPSGVHGISLDPAHAPHCVTGQSNNPHQYIPFLTDHGPSVPQGSGEGGIGQGSRSSRAWQGHTDNRQPVNEWGAHAQPWSNPPLHLPPQSTNQSSVQRQVLDQATLRTEAANHESLGVGALERRRQTAMKARVGQGEGDPVAADGSPLIAPKKYKCMSGGCNGEFIEEGSMLRHLAFHTKDAADRRNIELYVRCAVAQTLHDICEDVEVPKALRKHERQRQSRGTSTNIEGMGKPLAVIESKILGKIKNPSLRRCAFDIANNGCSGEGGPETLVCCDKCEVWCHISCGGVSVEMDMLPGTATSGLGVNVDRYCMCRDCAVRIVGPPGSDPPDNSGHLGVESARVEGASQGGAGGEVSGVPRMSFAEKRKEITRRRAKQQRMLRFLDRDIKGRGPEGVFNVNLTEKRDEEHGGGVGGYFVPTSDPDYAKAAECQAKGCNQTRRPSSKYCSDKCGVLMAEIELAESVRWSLEGREGKERAIRLRRARRLKTHNDEVRRIGRSVAKGDYPALRRPQEEEILQAIVVRRWRLWKRLIEIGAYWEKVTGAKNLAPNINTASMVRTQVTLARAREHSRCGAAGATAVSGGGVSAMSMAGTAGMGREGSVTGAEKVLTSTRITGAGGVAGDKGWVRAESGGSIPGGLCPGKWVGPGRAGDGGAAGTTGGVWNRPVEAAGAHGMSSVGQGSGGSGVSRGGTAQVGEVASTGGMSTTGEVAGSRGLVRPGVLTSEGAGRQAMMIPSGSQKVVQAGGLDAHHGETQGGSCTMARGSATSSGTPLTPSKVVDLTTTSTKSTSTKSIQQQAYLTGNTQTLSGSISTGYGANGMPNNTMVNAGAAPYAHPTAASAVMSRFSVNASLSVVATPGAAMTTAVAESSPAFSSNGAVFSGKHPAAIAAAMPMGASFQGRDLKRPRGDENHAKDGGELASQHRRPHVVQQQVVAGHTSVRPPPPLPPSRLKLAPRQGTGEMMCPYCGENSGETVTKHLENCYKKAAVTRNKKLKPLSKTPAQSPESDSESDNGDRERTPRVSNQGGAGIGNGGGGSGVNNNTNHPESGSVDSDRQGCWGGSELHKRYIQYADISALPDPTEFQLHQDLQGWHHSSARLDFLHKELVRQRNTAVAELKALDVDELRLEKRVRHDWLARFLPHPASLPN